MIEIKDNVRLETVARVWERNNMGKKFKAKDTGEVFTVSKVIFDKSLQAWCAVYRNELKLNTTNSYKPIHHFNNEYERVENDKKDF